MESAVHDKNKWLALLGISLNSLLVFIDITIVNTVLAPIQKSLAASMLQLQWVMNIYLLTYCVTLIIAGRLSDMLSHSLINYTGVIVFAFASLAAGLAPNPQILILCRAFQGIAIAMLIPSALGLITHTFPIEERSKAIGVWSSITGIGMIIGPALGGILVTWLSWRWVFFINVPIALLGLLLCVFTVNENKASIKVKMDWLGASLIALGVASLVLAIIQGPSWGFTAVPIISLFSCGIAALVTLYFVEKKVEAPIIRFDLFNNAIYLSCALGYFTLVALMFTGLFFIPLYLHNVLNYTTWQVGLILLCVTFVVVLLSPFTGQLSERIGAKAIIVLGFVALSAGMLWQAFFSTETQLGIIIPGLLLFGLGWGLTFSPMKSEAIAALPERYAGIASGVLTAVDSFGGAIGLAIAGVIFRYREKKVLLQHLTTAKIGLSQELQAKIAAILTDPAKAHAIISQMSGALKHNILLFFRLAFSQAFNSVMWFLFAMAALTTFVIMWLMGKKAANSLPPERK